VKKQMRQLEERLDTLAGNPLETATQQQAREQQASARQHHHEQQQEKQRVFLVGKYALEKARGNLAAWATLCHALDEVLIRKVDRGLFGLAPLLMVKEKGGTTVLTDEISDGVPPEG